MEESQATINILASMITPAVLILACGSLSLTTSQRLSRSIERTRKVSGIFNEINQGSKHISEAEKKMLYRQLIKSAKRAELMQQTMTLLYIAMSLFIATSLLIGIFEIMNWAQPLFTIILAMVGAVLLLAASVTLIMETRLALAAVKDEMEFFISNYTIKE